MSFWGVRNYNKHLRRRGGWTAPTGPGFKYKDAPVYDGTPFRVDGYANNGNNGTIARRPTGGRATGKIRSNETGRANRRRRPNYAIDQDKVKDGPYVVGPMPYNKPSYEYLPIPVPFPMDFGIKRKRIRPTHTGSSYSYSKLFFPKRTRKTKLCRSMQRFAPMQSAEYFSTFRIETATGTQNYASVSWLGVPALNNMSVGASSGSGAKTADLWVKGANVSLMMTNNCNANLFMEIWEGYYRRSSKNEASYLWNQGLKDQGMSGPTVPSGFTTMPDNTYQMDPLKSRLFCQFVRITDVQTVELGPGHSHQHRSRLYANAKYSNELYWEHMVQDSVPYIDGFTRLLMVIIRGGPINDETTQTNVSTAPVAVDCVMTTKYNYFYNTPNTTSTYTSGSFPSISIPKTINEASGAAVTVGDV